MILTSLASKGYIVIILTLLYYVGKVLAFLLESLSNFTSNLKFFRVNVDPNKYINNNSNIYC